MKRYTFDHRLGVMRECPKGEWVMHDSVAAHVAYRIKVARLQSMCRPVLGLEPESREALPVAFLPLDAPGDGVDIDRVHRRAAAVVES